jgi:hypothetical protein
LAGQQVGVVVEVAIKPSIPADVDHLLDGLRKAGLD